MHVLPYEETIVMAVLKYKSSLTWFEHSTDERLHRFRNGVGAGLHLYQCWTWEVISVFHWFSNLWEFLL
jgi:hypothetical protein